METIEEITPVKAPLELELEVASAVEITPIMFKGNRYIEKNRLTELGSRYSVGKEKPYKGTRANLYVRSIKVTGFRDAKEAVISALAELLENGKRELKADAYELTGFSHSADFIGDSEVYASAVFYRKD